LSGSKPPPFWTAVASPTRHRSGERAPPLAFVGVSRTHPDAPVQNPRVGTSWECLHIVAGLLPHPGRWGHSHGVL